VRLNALGGRHKLVVEKMVQLTRTGLPADFLHLARFKFAIGIAVGLAFVIVIATFSRPIRMDLRVKGPVRNVKTFDRIGEGGAFEPVWGEPTSPVPAPNRVANL